MLTSKILLSKLKEYKPPFHHHIRDEIYDDIISEGEAVFPIIIDVLENDTLHSKQKALLEKSLWDIGGSAIMQFFVKRAENDYGYRLHLRKLDHIQLLQLRDKNPSLIKKMYNSFPEDRVVYCDKHQGLLGQELPKLGLTVPQLPFNVVKATWVGIKDCPVCGKKPTEQRWLYYWSPIEDWDKMRGRAGWVGICDNCEIQASQYMVEIN